VSVNERRRGLGRGLGALIPTAPDDDKARTSPIDVFFTEDGTEGAVPRETPSAGVAVDGQQRAVSRETVGEAATALDEDLVPVDGAQFAEVDVAKVRPNPRQPRTAFDEEEMAELVHSIREIGLLQPIVVRRVDDPEVEFEIVMGERRWRATREAGLETVPAIVRETSDTDMLRDALLENLHRSELNPLEEGAAYQQLLDDFSCTHDELATRLGRSRPQITNTIRLLRLPPLVQRRVAAGVLSAGHARAVLGMSDPGAQEKLAQRIVAEGLSVRSVEEIVTLDAGQDTDQDDDANSPEPKPQRGQTPVAPRLNDIAAALSDELETRVKVNLGRSKGKITIEFASIGDLERIVGTIAPSVLDT